MRRISPRKAAAVRIYTKLRHVHATLHPAEAIEQGWSLPRIGGAA